MIALGVAGAATEIGANRLVRLLGDWQVRGGALHEELTEALRGLIRSGALPAGIRLPSERSLRAALGVSRNTVTKSLDTLRGDGLLASRQGSGTFVAVRPRRALRTGGDRLRSFVGAESADAIDLRSAALPGLSMVADALPKLDQPRTRALLDGHGYLPAGLPELREAVARYYRDAGLPTTARHILITSGAQQALRLAAAAHVVPGSTVLVEEPTFRGALESLRSLGARLVAVPSGRDGVDVDMLTRALREEQPALVVLQSTVHNPTGSVLRPFARSRIAAVTRQHQVPVLDDATLADTLIEPASAAACLAVGGDHILTVGSVSKSFWGGLRVGWLRAHPDVVAEMAATKGGEDLGTSVLAQIAAAALLPDIDAARHERRAQLSERRDAALAAVADLLPDAVVEAPAGGGSLWVRLPRGGANALAQRAERHGVRILPGSTFSVTDRLDDHIRLSYAGDPAVTQAGIERTAAAWAEMARAD